MNNVAVTKFLAEQLNPKHIKIGDNSYPVIVSDKVDTPDMFDPIHKIEHAWMVVEKLADTGIVIDLDFDAHEYRVHLWNLATQQLDGMEMSPSAPKAICVAAVRALASEDQIEEWL